MSPARRALETAARSKAGRLFIGGEWVDPISDRQIPVFDPATETEIARLAAANAEDVNRAVRAARATFESTSWRKMRPLDRGRLLERLALLVERDADQLAELETLDNGKPLWVTRNVDMAFSMDALRYYGGWASKTPGEYIALSPFFDDGATYRAYTERVPVGVVAGITPWNFPMGQAIQKMAPAIAFGCTIVLKPSEETSLTTLKLMELIQEADFPPGSVNLVTGYGHDAGQALVTHPKVSKVSFTGSTRTGQHILAASSATMKRVTLECGGKSPTIVLADADLDQAIQGAANAIFANSGQICTAGSRLFIEAPVYDAVVQGVSEIARTMTLGSGFDAGNQLGPLVSQRQLTHVSGFVDRGLQAGAQAIAGAGRAHDKGYFFKPTVLVGASPESEIAREEIFGPVVVAMPFHDQRQVSALANDTEFGLGASIWTRDLNAAHLISSEIDSGTVWINTHNILDTAMPFGGMKLSGIGREFGSEAMHAFTETRAVCMRLAR